MTDVVIGAGSGMGAAVAARLAGPRRTLLLADRDPDAAAAVAAGLPGDVAIVACDITDPDAVAALGLLTCCAVAQHPSATAQHPSPDVRR